MHFKAEVLVVVCGLLIAYGVFSYLTYRRYNPSRLWVPAICAAVYTVMNIDGWLSWPAVAVTVSVLLSWRKHRNGIDTGYRVIADLTSGRFGVPRQEPGQPSAIPEESSPILNEDVNESVPEFDIPDSWFMPPSDDTYIGNNSDPMYAAFME